MRNIDKLKAMSTWELAEFIKNVADNCVKITTCNNLCKECEQSNSWCVSMVAEWLNEEVEND